MTFATDIDEYLVAIVVKSRLQLHHTTSIIDFNLCHKENYHVNLFSNDSNGELNRFVIDYCNNQHVNKINNLNHILTKL